MQAESKDVQSEQWYIYTKPGKIAYQIIESEMRHDCRSDELNRTGRQAGGVRVISEFLHTIVTAEDRTEGTKRVLRADVIRQSCCEADRVELRKEKWRDGVDPMTSTGAGAAGVIMDCRKGEYHTARPFGAAMQVPKSIQEVVQLRVRDIGRQIVEVGLLGCKSLDLIGGDAGEERKARRGWWNNLGPRLCQPAR